MSRHERDKRDCARARGREWPTVSCREAKISTNVIARVGHREKKKVLSLSLPHAITFVTFMRRHGSAHA